MSGIQIDYAALEAAFENHAPDVRSFLDRESGEVLVLSTSGPEKARVHSVSQDGLRYLPIEPVASREQYRMMEQFIESVKMPSLQQQLQDAIVGKGAFRRFKDTVGRVPDERKRWFAFRDVLLHRHILDWLKGQSVVLTQMPDWAVELPEAPDADEPPPVSEEGAPVVGDEPKDAQELTAYLQAWARAHGEEYRHIFGPSAFERLAQDICQEFSFFRRR